MPVPARHVVSRHANELSPAEQRAYYEEEGYLVFPQLLDSVELGNLRTALAEVLHDADGLTETNDKFSITRTDDGGFSVRRIFDPIARHAAFRDLVLSPKILDIVENLIGPNIQLHHTKLNLKPPSSREARFEWHQDYPFFPHTNFDLLAVMIYLDDATEENGCLCVVPGSHYRGLVPHCPGKSETRKALHIPDDLRGPDYTPVPIRRGSVLFLHRRTMHASLPNRSDGVRWSFDLRYQPIGQPTGRPWFPAFVVRSRQRPETAVTDWRVWAQLWRAARSHLSANPPTGKFNRWTGEEPVCAEAL
jgi:ectoine hydroxylase-related dioxygenase (phytanoyl-CoA dioxygenase family)